MMMNRKITIKRMVAMLFVATIFTACSDDPDQPGNSTGGEIVPSVERYIIAANEGTATYLLTAESLFEGSVSVVGNGFTTTQATYWPFHNDFLVGLRYADGDATVTNRYYLNANTVSLTQDPTAFNLARLTSYGTFGDYIITSAAAPLGATYADEDGQIPEGLTFSFLNMVDGTTTENTEAIFSENYLGNGEYVTLTGILESGGRIFTAPAPMGLSQYGVDANNGEYVIFPDLVTTEAGGTNSSAYDEGELQWTQHPNEAWLAIYSSVNDMRTGAAPTLVRDDRISYAAGRNRSQYYQMIWTDDDDNVYMFSPSYAKTFTNVDQRTVLPAGVIRMPAGSSSFDDYYVNIEELSGGRSFLRSWHAGDDKFLLLMYDQPFTVGQAIPAALSLAIFDASEQSLTFVEGLPAARSGYANDVWTEDGYVHVAVSTSDGQFPAIYNIDIETVTATRGLEIQASAVAGLGQLNGRLPAN